MKVKVYLKLNRLLHLLLLFAACSSVYAQQNGSQTIALNSNSQNSYESLRPLQKTITGTITSVEDGEPLPGVSILIVGTNTGTISDIDGNYSISANSDQVLRFSFIGFAEQEVEVGAQSVINISMSADSEELEEIIVTGYSVDTRRETTGSVSTVKSKDLTVVPSGNVEQQLQGRVAGVTVITNGQPGTTSQIRVRGFGAFSGNEPLYVVDGVPVTSTEFLNPDDIESTTVLKDAAAASIYGARAANGVIVYTTKQGKKGPQKLKVTYDGMVGFTDPGTGSESLNPQDFAEWTWNAIKNTARQNDTDPVFNHPQFGTGSNPQIPQYLLVGNTSGFNGTLNLEEERANYNVDPEKGDIYQVTKPNLAGTDWYDAITRTALLTRHSIGMSGGGEGNRFYIGLGAQEQEGILIHQNFRRYTARINSEFDILPNLRLGQNFQGTYRQVRLLLGGGGGQGSSNDENVILSASRMPTIIPIYDEFGGYAGTRAQGFNNPNNPVAALDGDQNDRGFNGSAFGNVYLEFEPIEGLTLRSSVGGRYNGSYFWGYTRRTYENSENNGSFGYNEGSGYNFSWIFTNTANYKKIFGGYHEFDILLGQESLNTGSGRNINASGLNPFSQDTDFVTLSVLPADTRQVNSDYYKGVNFSSYFGRLKYTFNDKYMLSFVVRRDGSSRFGSENRYGVFPAFSAAWRISDEAFLESATFIDDLKIRGGYGIMGNSNNVDPNNQYSLYATSIGASSYDISGTNNSAAEGFYRSRIGNPFAQWEKAITQNIGFDGRFFNDKLDVIVDFWQKDTEDLLFQVPVTVMNGVFATPPSRNVAKMVNKGIDIQVITRGDVGQIGYEVTVNGGVLKNEIVELAEDLDYISGINPDFRGIQPIRNQVGQPISAFFGYEVEGLFSDQADVDAHATQEGAAPGRFKFKDIDGNGEINSDDRTYLGAPVPKFTGGLNIKLDYKNFSLETYSFMSLGSKIFNQSKWFTHFYTSFAGSNKSAAVKDSWTFEDPNSDIPIFEDVSNFSTNTQSNSWYVETGSYFRMQNITLAYNFPTAALQKLRMEKLRVFAGLNNIFTISGYSGLDPSVGGDADTQFGIDVGNYPITRSFTFGVNVGF